MRPTFLRRFRPLIAVGLLGGLGLACGHAAPAVPDYPVDIRVVPAPSAQPLASPALVTAGNGTVWQVWIEHAGSGGKLCLARFDPATGSWTGRRDIWSDPRIAPIAGQPLPVVTDEHGPSAVLWTRAISTGTQLVLSRRAAKGAHWLPPVEIATVDLPLTPAALAHGPDDRLELAWIEIADESRAVLHTQTIAANSSDAITTAAENIAANAAPALAVFPDGSALLAFTGVNPDQSQDMRLAAGQNGTWQAPRSLEAQLHALPAESVSAPHLAVHGGQVALVWLAAKNGEPRLQFSASPDAGRRFTLPQRIDQGHPRGEPSALMLRDGSALVAWFEVGELPGLYLRHLPSRQAAHPAVRLAITPGGLTGSAVLALVKDYDSQPAQVLITHPTTRTSSPWQTLLVTLPDLSTLAGREPCLPCDEADAKATRGYAVRGRITALQTDVAVVMLEHGDIPGVMRASTLPCRVDPELLTGLTAGVQVLGRIERRGREWWLFNVKLLGEPIRG